MSAKKVRFNLLNWIAFQVHLFKKGELMGVLFQAGTDNYLFRVLLLNRNGTNEFQDFYGLGINKGFNHLEIHHCDCVE